MPVSYKNLHFLPICTKLVSHTLRKKRKTTGYFNIQSNPSFLSLSMQIFIKSVIF